MDTCTSLPSLPASNTSQVSLPFCWVLAQVWRVVSRMYLLLFGGSPSGHWIERETVRAFFFSPKFFREKKKGTLIQSKDCFETVVNSTQLHKAVIFCAKEGKNHDLYKGLHFIFTLSLFKKNCSHVKIPPRLSTESRK